MSERPTKEYNQAVNGIELKFEHKPSADTLAQIKEQGFRWHTKKKLWFAKNTPARDTFAKVLCGEKPEEKAPEAKPEPRVKESAKQPAEGKKPNTFASSYDKVGDSAVLKDASSSLFECMDAFCEKEQIHYRRTYGGDSITITDLANAQKTGANCTTWNIYPALGADRSQLFLNTLSHAGVKSITDLLDMCRSEKTPEDVQIYRREEKGVDVFSPFVEVKPLKDLPEKWTKRNFTQALMSGQLFRGEVDYHYTDDYAMDAAYGFGTGRGLDMPTFVKNEVGDWGSCTYCRTCGDAPDKTGAWAIGYSEHSNSSKTLYFDVNCDIAEGKRRAEQRETARENYNKMMEAGCIKVDIKDIDPTKIYHVTELDMNINTGVYGTRECNLQGDCLINRLDPECCVMDLLGVEEMEIVPDHFYSVADFHNRLSALDLDEERIIPVGNWGHIVSGKALLELTAEGQYFPHIQEACDGFGPTFEQAHERLSKFANGQIRIMGGVDNTDFRASLNLLISEYQRAGGTVREDLIPKKESKVLDFSSLVKSAQERQISQAQQAQKSGVLDFTRN